MRFLQNALLKPQDYSVIATMNLNGDYVSDMLAAQVGGIGIAPGANINYQTGHAIFEATHGIAPDIAGQNKGESVFHHIVGSDDAGLYGMERSGRSDN